MRESVQWFGEQMEAKLQENDHKGGWEGCTTSFLLGRIQAELRELEIEINGKPCGCRGLADCPHFHLPNKDRVIQEAADVANFAHMLADLARKGMLY